MGAQQQVFDRLEKLRGTRTLIVGIGSTLKADDGAGPLVCEKLRSAQIGAELIDAGTVPENHIQPIVKKTPQNLLIIDAVDFGASPGAVDIFKPEQISSFVFSTHTLSPHLFVDMIKKAIDVDIYLVGIQPAQTRLGDPVSPHVSQAIEAVARAIIAIFPPAR
jgi:hydrogenase maturation protease HycI